MFATFFAELHSSALFGKIRDCFSAEPTLQEVQFFSQEYIELGFFQLKGQPTFFCLRQRDWIHVLTWHKKVLCLGENSKEQGHWGAWPVWRKNLWSKSIEPSTSHISALHPDNNAKFTTGLDQHSSGAKDASGSWNPPVLTNHLSGTQKVRGLLK